MASKNNQIETLKAEQAKIRKKIKRIKSDIPKHLLFIIFIGFCIVFYLEPKYYYWAGDGVSFVKYGLGIFIVIALIYAYIRFRLIDTLSNEIDKINGKLYKLMRLADEGEND